MPAVPIIFFKPPTALIGDGDTIRLPGVSQRVEFEAEIGVVIGSRARNLTPAEAVRAIGGLHLRQRRHLPRPPEGGRPVGPGEGVRHLLPGRAPGGPGARLAQPGDHLPGERGRERSGRGPPTCTFPIPDLVSFLSGIMTLEPGDLIATGTPAGTAPLKDGDRVEVEIPGVGVLLQSSEGRHDNDRVQRSREVAAGLSARRDPEHQAPAASSRAWM